MKRKYQTEYDTSKLKSWIRLHKGFNPSFYVEKAGYFDERPQLNISLTGLITLLSLPILLSLSPMFLLLMPLIFIGWGQLYINLPIKTGIQDCESAAWGFNFHDSKIWIYIGGGGNYEGGRKWKTISMPWELDWYRTSLLLSDQTWANEYRGNRLDFHKDEWIQKRWQIRAIYTDPYDLSQVGTILHITEREWRPKALKWTRLFNKVRRTVEAEFDKEVGPRKGSWKGGTIATGFTIDPNKDLLQSIQKLGFEALQLKRELKLNQLELIDDGQ